MQDFVTRENISKIPTRIFVVLYAVMKLVYIMLFSPEYTIVHLIAGTALVLVLFVLTGAKKLSNIQQSIFVPTASVLIELAATLYVGGDALIYVFLIGCAVVSVLFTNHRGLLIFMSITSVLIGVSLAFGLSFLGGEYSP